MIVKQLNEIKPVNKTPKIYSYNFQPRMVKPVPVPFSRQELLRRRAEEAAKHFMQSQAQSFTDPGINEYYAQGIRDKYDLVDDTGLRTAGQVIGGAVGVGFGISMGMKAGAAIGTAVGGPVGTALGAVAGTIIGLGQVYLGAAIGGTVASPSGWYGSYDLMRSLLVHSVKNPISTMGTVASMSAGAIVGSKLGGAVGGEVAKGLGTIIGTATGMTAGGIAFDKLEEELLKNRDLNVGLSPIMAVGNTMDQVTGANAFKSSLLSLQGDGELLDNLSKAYGIGEDGFTRVDFSDIRKNTGLDIGVFGNGLIDYLGEVVMDPTNWAQWTFSDVNRKATDTTEASLVAKAGRKFSDNRVNKVMELLEAKDVQGAAKVYKYLPTELKTEVLPTLVARQLSAGQMRQIGRIMLDSTIDNTKSMRDFRKIFITDPNLRSFVKDSIGKGQDLNKVINNLYDSMSADIMPKLSLGDIAAIKKIKANKRSVAENIEMMRKIDPNFDSFDYLPKHLQHEYRTKGFNFTPMHYKMLNQQYPGLKQYNDYLDTFNKTLMRVSNPLMTLGLGGMRKLWDAVKHSDRGIKSLIKHIGKIEQGKVPFIEVTNKDGFLSMKKSDYFRKSTKEIQDIYQTRLNEYSLLKEEARQLINDEVVKRQEKIEELDKKVKTVSRKIQRQRKKYQKELDFLYGQLRIYDGDTFIDATTAELHKKRVAEIKKEIQDPINSEHRADLELELVKLEGLLHQWDMLQGRRLVHEEALDYYLEIEHALNTVKTIRDYYQNYYDQYTKANTHLEAQWGSFDSWVMRQEGYKSLVVSYAKDFDKLIAVMDSGKIPLLLEAFEISSESFRPKLEYLRNHPMTKHFENVKEALGLIKSEKSTIKKDYDDTLDNYIEQKVKNRDITEYEYKVNNKYENHKQVLAFLESFKAFSKMSTEAFQNNLKALNIPDEHARGLNYFSRLNEFGNKRGLSPIETISEDLYEIMYRLEKDAAYDDYDKARRIVGYDVEEIETNIRRYLSYLFDRYSPSDMKTEYMGNEEDTHGYNMGEFENYIKDTLGIDLEDYIGRRIDNETLLNKHVKIFYNYSDGKKLHRQEINGFKNFFAFVDKQLNKKFGGGEYFSEAYKTAAKKYEGSKKTLYDKYHVVAEVKKLYRLASKNFGTIQKAQNYNRISMYTDPAVLNIIDQLYNAFLNNPSETEGGLKLLADFIQDNPTLNSKQLNQIKEFVIQSRHSMELIQRFPKEAFVNYPDNNFIGTFFDVANIINMSGIFNAAKYEGNMAARKLELEKLITKLELRADESPAIKFIIFDLKSKFFNEADPNSIINKGEESVYLSNSYFSELDMFRSKKILGLLETIYMQFQGNITAHLDSRKIYSVEEAKIEDGVYRDDMDTIGVEVNADKILRSTFYEPVIEAWRVGTVDKLHQTSIENDAFRFNLYDSSAEQFINSSKPFNIAELVKRGAPYTWRRADKLNLWSKQKRLLNIFTDQRSTDIFNDVITLEQHTEYLADFLGVKSSSFKNYEEVIDKMQELGSDYTNFLLEQKGIDARTLLRGVIFKAFDTETLGLKTEQENYTFQIGGADSEGKVFNRRITDRIITKVIEELTGFTQKDLTKKGGALPLETVMEEFYNWLNNPEQQNKVIAGHNVQFDIGHLKADMKQLGLEFPDLPIIDTLWLAQRLYGEKLASASLENVFNFLKERIINSKIEEGFTREQIEAQLKELSFHDATDDSIATLLVLEQMLKEHKEFDYLEQVRVDYKSQHNFLSKLLGPDISRGFTEFDTLFYGEDPSFAKAVMEMIAEKSNDPEKSMRDIINEIKPKYEDADFANLPSARDLDILTFTAEFLGSPADVMEFFRFTAQLKNRGIERTYGNYMLSIYEQHYKHKDQALQKYVESMQTYNKDLTIEEVKKAYAHWMVKRFEDATEFISTQKTDDELTTKVEETKEAFRKGFDETKEAAKKTREAYLKAQELKHLKGGLEEKPGSTTLRDLKNMVENVPEDMIDAWMSERFKHIPEAELKVIIEKVKEHRRVNQGKINWDDPVINILKGYEGEPGEWIIETPDQARLSKIENEIYDYKEKSEEVANLIDRLQTLTKEEIFKKKDNSKEITKVEALLKKQYTGAEYKILAKLIKRANTLRIKTHEQVTPEAKYELINGELMPVSGEGYVLNFKQDLRKGEGYVEDGKDLLQELDYLKKLKEDEIQALKDYREKANEEFRKRFGGFNEYETGKQSKELISYLIDGDYTTFRKHLKELLPNEDAEAFIDNFKKNVLKQLKGEHPVVIKEFKRVHKIEDGYGDVPKEYYITEVTERTKLRNRDSINYELSGRAYYESWMEAEAIRLEADIENTLVTQQKLDGTYKPQERVEGTEYLAVKQELEPMMQEFHEIKPINTRVMEHEEHYTMDLGDIRSLFKDADELALFLKENPEYRLVGIGADNTEASKSPTRFRTLDSGEVIRKDNYLYGIKMDPSIKYIDAEKIEMDRQQEYTKAERAELEAYKVGKYDTDKPAIKEILWAGTNKLQKLFDYDPSELSIGIMSIDNFKQAKERSYKPFQFPPVLDKFYKNIIRLQKSEMLVSGRWHATNIIDIIRKNSTLTDMFRDSKEYIRAFKDATELQTKWTTIQQEYVNMYKEFDARLNEAYMKGDKEAIQLIRQDMEEWGSLGFDEFIKKRGIVNITPETLTKTQMDSELDLGTYLYLKHKKNNSFKRLKTDAERLKYLQERADDYILELKMTDEYQTSTATTDLPTFIQKMDNHELMQSDSFTRRVFRYMATENPIMKLNMKTATRIEQIGRLHGYLLDRYLYGTSHDAATHRSLQRHFDYSDRGAIEMYATLLFPFTAFPIRNALFWQNMLMDASMNRRLYHLMVAAWGSYDIEENEYAQAMQRQGYIPIGNTLMKIGDSRMSALQFGNSFGEVAQQRANPLYKLPLELLKGEQRPQDAILNTIPILRRIPGMVTQLQKGLKADQDDTLRRVFATGIGAVVGTAASPGIGTAIGGAIGAIGGGNAFPGIFGTIYNDEDYKNPVFTRRRYTYNNLYTKQGKLRTLSNNAYYRVRQIQYQNARRNYF